MRLDQVTDDDLASEVLATFVDRDDVHRVVIAPGATDQGDVLDLVRAAKAQGLKVSLLPRMFEVVGSSVVFDDVEGITLLGVRRFGLTRSSWICKRSFDLAGTTIGLVLLAPFLAVIAAAIRLDTRGPVFFRQQRVGRGGLRLRDGEVPHDGRRRGPPEGGPARAERGRRPVQDRRRPADHPRRAAPAPHLARRAAAAAGTSCAAR